MADSTSFSIDIETNAPGVQDASSALDVLRQRLEAAGQASSQAAAAVAASEAAYKQAEVGANRAAQAYEKIGLAVDAQSSKVKKLTDAGDTAGLERATAKLNELKDRQQQLGQKAEQAKASLLAEAASLDRLKQAAATASSAEEKIAKAHADAEAAAKRTANAGDEVGASSVNYRALSSALGKLGGPLGVAGQQAAGLVNVFQKLGKTLGAAGPYVAVAVAFVAIAAAGAVATVAMLKFAYANADAARTSLLLSQGIAGSVAGGTMLNDKIASLSKRLPQTRDELQSMAADLAKSGLRGEALTNALESAATNAAKAKFGPDFQKAMLSSEKQSQLLKDNIASLFTLKTDGLAGGIAKIVALFDETSASGRAIKVVFESLFQPLVDGLAGLAPKVVSTFIQFEIWVLKVLLLMKSYGPELMAVGKVLLTVGAVIGVVFGTVVAVLLTFMAISVAVGLAVWSIAVKLGELLAQGEQFAAAFIAGPGGAIDYLKAKIGEVVDWLSGLSLAEIGAQIIQGLAGGITGAAGAVYDSLTGAVTGAVDGVKNVLGIHSPSRKMHEEVGVPMGAGVAGGVDESAADVQSSLAAMVATPEVPAGAGGAKGGGNTFQFIIQAPSGDADDIVAAARKYFGDFLEGAVVQMGGEIPEGVT